MHLSLDISYSLFSYCEIYKTKSVFFKLTGRIRLSTGYYVFCLALLIQSAVMYHIYGTLNLTQTLTKELGVDQVRAIQVGFVVYFASFAYEFLRISFVYLILALLSERRIYLAVIISFIATYFLLLSGSKYSLVTIFYFMSTLAFFKLYKPKLYHALALLVLPIILGVLNIFRNTGQLQSIGWDSVRYLYKLISWRGDFFHGFYHLIEQIALGNINYYYGVNFFFLPLRIIPRSLFPERPGSSDQILTKQLFGFEEVTGWALNFGGIGDAILAFGIVGVPLAALIAGTIVGMLHRIFIISTNSSHSLLFLFAITNPIWFAPWNVGLNDVIARNFIMWLAAFALMYVIHKIKLR